MKDEAGLSYEAPGVWGGGVACWASQMARNGWQILWDLLNLSSETELLRLLTWALFSQGVSEVHLLYQHELVSI